MSAKEIFGLECHKKIIGEWNQKKAHVIYADIFLSSLLPLIIIYYSAFLSSVLYHCLALIMASVIFYRAAMFLHEVYHQKKNHPYCTLVYNVLFGYLHNLPSYFEDAHFYHHKTQTFGTRIDPDYERFQHRFVKAIVIPLCGLLFMPMVLFLRCGVIPLFYPLLTKSNKIWLFRKISTVTHQLSYEREKPSEHELKHAIRHDGFCMIYKMILVGLYLTGHMTFAVIINYYAVFILFLYMNHFRSLANHHYQSDFNSSAGLEEVLNDTLTIDTNKLGSLMFPVGLGYHALHHMYPSIAYYNLGTIHKRLVKELDPNNIYMKTVCNNWVHFIFNNYFRGKLG